MSEPGLFERAVMEQDVAWKLFGEQARLRGRRQVRVWGDEAHTWRKRRVRNMHLRVVEGGCMLLGWVMLGTFGAGRGMRRVLFDPERGDWHMVTEWEDQQIPRA